MKTLRTICYICAGYYALHCLGFIASGVIMHAMYGMMPAAMEANPVSAMQLNMAGIMGAFAPYLLIGTAICLVMALRTAQLMKIIPVLAVLLIAGGLVFVAAFAKASQHFAAPMDGMMSGAPEAFRTWMNFIVSISRWSSALPVVLPGVLILIFRRRTGREGA